VKRFIKLLLAFYVLYVHFVAELLFLGSGAFFGLVILRPLSQP
jgi:uncharacterized membrane protein